MCGEKKSVIHFPGVLIGKERSKVQSWALLVSGTRLASWKTITPRPLAAATEMPLAYSLSPQGLACQHICLEELTHPAAPFPYRSGPRASEKDRPVGFLCTRLCAQCL